jgi:hypothetical protein
MESVTILLASESTKIAFILVVLGVIVFTHYREMGRMRERQERINRLIWSDIKRGDMDVAVAAMKSVASPHPPGEPDKYPAELEKLFNRLSPHLTYGSLSELTEEERKRFIDTGKLPPEPEW